MIHRWSRTTKSTMIQEQRPIIEHIAQLRKLSERKVFVTMGSSMGLCAALWCAWCAHQGMLQAAIIPGLYMTVAVVSMLSMWRESGETFHRHLLLTAGLLLPFIFQMNMGGIAASGMVMIWCLPSLVAAVNLQGGSFRYVYLATTGLLLILAAVYDPVIVGDRGLVGISGNWLLAFNLGTSMPANFILADRMLRAQRELRKRVFALQRESQERFVQTLEERNRDMQQSLDYAARIQMALWPEAQRIRGLFEEMHVHYRPKESVGGDLIWHARAEDRSYFIVLDCTGHGVPGSLMSMLMHGLLNEVVHTGRNLSAADVVRRTQHLLSDRLDRGRTGNTDGAEMAVLCFDHGRRRVSCCSYGCGIIVQDGEHITHLKSHSGSAALMSGSRLNELREHVVSVTPGTRLFMYTDGVADQFCAKDHRKFSRARLERTLREACELAPADQLAHFEAVFGAWRGRTELVDDVLLVGVVPAACWQSILDDELESDAA
jgi:serine phosphatase RsbU (regulator of sigma subunit)